MVSRESKEIIIKFIRQRGGKATKNNVVDYMKSEEVEEKFRLSRVSTLNAIQEIEEGDRIKVVRGKRRGQSHRLIVNSECEFIQINKDLSKLAEYIKLVNEASAPIANTEKIMQKLQLLLAATYLYIKDQSDSDLLYKKIINSMLSITFNGTLIED